MKIHQPSTSNGSDLRLRTHARALTAAARTGAPHDAAATAHPAAQTAETEGNPSMPTLEAPALHNPLFDALHTVGSLRIDRRRQRWDVVRSGARGDIDPQLRALVFARDNHCCRWCSSTRRLRLDHVVPWSAGGPDAGWNLRVLCERCNSGRQNFAEAYLPRLLPVTNLCEPCAGYWDVRHEGYDGHFPVWCGRCTSTSWVAREDWLW
jgi:5-methylcytosine-specific restriction endonuclease McrA